MSRYRREIDTQCCNAWMHGIRTINGQYPDDNRDFDINAGNGIRIEPATGGITIINDSAASSFIAGDNIEITPSGNDLVIGLTSDPIINGDLQVNGDIIQNGSAYETHAEKVYTTNDYIVTRDGAVSALSSGDYSGFQVKKYDGTNDGRLVIDNAGVARVGDVGDEQPLLTRDESASLTNGNLLQWNGTSQKAVDAGINTSQIQKKINYTNIASMLFSTASIANNNQWNTQTASTITISANNPYFVNDGGKIKLLQEGTYIIFARLNNSISTYEAIEISDLNIFQNGIHNTQISQILTLNVNDTITGALYGSSGSGSFEQYNGLNRIDVIKL